MNHILNGKRIVLRTPTINDVHSIYTYAREPEISRYTTLPQPYLLSHAKKFIKDTALVHRKQQAYHFAIIWKESGKLIGMIGLEHYDKTAKKAELGYWLGKPYWGQKIMQEAMRLVLQFGFKTLRLQRIYARTMHPNIASTHLLLKHGFKHEGILRRHIFRNNEWLDQNDFGLLKEEHHR